MRRIRDESGVTAIAVALITVAMLIPLAAFTVDLGVQRVARRDMQSVADIGALDLSRSLSGGTLSSYSSATLLGMANASRDRNSDSVGVVPTMQVALGSVNPARYGHSDYFTKMTDPSAVPTAVRVTASTTVQFGFLPGNGGATRSAIGELRSSACFKMGTLAASLATNQSALNGLLGNALGISALSYNGLAGVGISLPLLATALGVGSPNELVNLHSVTIGNFVLAMATALSNTPGSPAASVTLLQTIRTNLIAANTDGRVIDIGNILDVGSGNNSGLDVTADALDLLTGSAFVANGTNAIAVPNLGLTIPNVTALSTTLKVVEAPRIACNDGVAKSGQLQLEINGTVNVGLGALLPVLKGPIKIRVDLAKASAQLSSVTCPSNTPTAVSITVADQTLASTSVDMSALAVGAIPLLGLNVATTQPGVAGTYALALPTYYEPNWYQTPQTPTSLPPLANAQVNVLGLPLGALLVSPLLAVLNPIISGINSVITNTLAPALGLRIAGVDLSVLHPATCSSPRLAG